MKRKKKSFHPLHRFRHTEDSSISRNLAFSLVLIILILAIFLFTFIHLGYSRMMYHDLENRADEYISRITDILAMPMWAFDTQNIQIIGSELAHNDLVNSVRITDYKGRVLFEADKQEPRSLLTQRDGDITFNGKTIGHAEVTMTMRKYKQDLNRLVTLAIFTLLGTILVILIGTRYLLQVFLRSPITSLQKAIDEMAAGVFREEELGKINYREFSGIITRFNEMSKKIKAREHDLNIANTKLKKEISERIATENELKRIQTYLDNVINSMPSALIGIGPDGKITIMNKEAEKLADISENQAIGKQVADIFPQYSTYFQDIQQTISEKKHIKKEKIQYTDEKTIRYSDMTMYPLYTEEIQGAVVRIDDVTEHVKFEEMMIQSEKMMSVGGLAAGMAHEINNPLGIILQGIQNTFRRLSPEFEKNKQLARECGTTLEHIQAYLEKRNIFQYLQGIQDAGSRASKIVKNMLSFSRRSGSIMSPTDLNLLLDKTIELASNDYDLKKRYDFRHIEIIRDYDAALTPVSCSPTEIEQVILNLLKNSTHAIAEKTPKPYTPYIKIQTRKEKDYAVIAVKDNGAGMDAETRKRIFEPFYTTKTDRGTGLGLSVAYFIITSNHNGTLAVDSEPQKGAKFTIRLPLERKKPEA